MRTPPLNIQTFGGKLPKFALVIVWKGGVVENPEFVADYYEGDDGFVGELWRWKKRVRPTIPADKPFELWAKVDREWITLNPDSPVV